MVRLADSYPAAQTVVLLEPGVVRDVAHALSGLWRPEDEGVGGRRDQLVAAARLRLYGSAADRSGWFLTTTSAAHQRAEARGDVEWSAGFIPALDRYEDAPPKVDIDAMVGVLRGESRLDAEAATTLALGLLCEPVGMVVARDPASYRHNRAHDLPERLRIVDAIDAVRSLGLQVGEPPAVPPPVGSALAASEPWWVPVADEPALAIDPGASPFGR